MRSREGGRAKYISLRGMDCDGIVNTVLASSAIPMIYPNRMVDSDRCADGDFSDKTPYLPLAETGYERIIILHLNSHREAKERRLEYQDDTALDGKVRLYHLYPGNSLGNFLLITRRVTEERMRRGYMEGTEFLKSIDEWTNANG